MKIATLDAIKAIVNNIQNLFMPKSGGEFTGDVTIKYARGLTLEHQTGAGKMRIGVGGGGVNRGIWDANLQAWVFELDTTTANHVNLLYECDYPISAQITSGSTKLANAGDIYNFTDETYVKKADLETLVKGIIANNE